jgi:hypothetical protein
LFRRLLQGVSGPVYKDRRWCCDAARAGAYLSKSLCGGFAARSRIVPRVELIDRHESSKPGAYSTYSSFVSVWVCATVARRYVPGRVVLSGTSLRCSPRHTTSFPIIVARRDTNSHRPRSIAQKDRRANDDAWRQDNIAAAADGRGASLPGAVGICTVQPGAGTVRRHTNHGRPGGRGSGVR